jgi:hydrogenase maturation protein HypF
MNDEIAGVQIKVQGVVQGVGFRPYVYQLASRYDLKGWVCNTSEGVRIEAEGAPTAIERFLQALPAEAPPRAMIEELIIERTIQEDREVYSIFEIVDSRTEEGKYQIVSPDIGICPDCLKEILDPGNRRYRYPFTNCTNCGPRFTIIEDIPYDRPLTTMRNFEMCPECRKEYEDPFNRRFHAQPNACPRCGPSLTLLDGNGNAIDGRDSIAMASRLVGEGKIVAVKGLGGFLLACDATNESVVRLLRQRKHRATKPFAVMLVSLDEARGYCTVSGKEAEILSMPASPIVLLDINDNAAMAPSVAPGLKHLGVMLPYTPLHHLLLRDCRLPLVMTSGNFSEEPIAKDNNEALQRLSGIADYFLVHNRDIYSRYDDSVVMAERGDLQVVRRARGYAPYPIHLSSKVEQTLGCGAELKNTFCLTRDRYAFVSQHIGDMENLETFEHFEKTVALYQKLFRIEPTIIAHDLHPDYLATKYAQERAAQSPGVRLVPVQHHYAHIVSGMVDNGVSSPVIGVAFDGTGYGTDGNIWGGEFLIADYRGFTRAGHLEYLPLPGGDLAVKKPYRAALGYVISLLGEEAVEGLAPFRDLDPEEIKIIKRQVTGLFNAPLTSSCGRLFDAVSALMGVRVEIDYEGQAAIELEALAADAAEESQGYGFAVVEGDESFTIKLGDLFSGIASDLKKGMAKPVMATKFHNTIAIMITQTCQSLAEKTGIGQVVLSGGVFQNRLLLRKAVNRLESAGLEVLTHRQVPCNDGGISLGQAVAANFHGSDSCRKIGEVE